MCKEMDTRPPLIAKKVCNMLHVILLMIQKGVLKSKFMLDLHFLMKRGKNLGKALNDIMVQQHHSLSCISHDVDTSFISPREYEFSCSNSPPYKFYKQPYYQARKRKLHAHYKRTRFHAPSLGRNDGVSSCGGSSEVAVEASPLVGSAGWFGTWSPLVRQVRITDSPFSFTAKDADEDCHVDKEAEKFIEMFYKELRLQKWMTGREAADQVPLM